MQPFNRKPTSKNNRRRSILTKEKAGSPILKEFCACFQAAYKESNLERIHKRLRSLNLRPDIPSHHVWPETISFHLKGQSDKTCKGHCDIDIMHTPEIARKAEDIWIDQADEDKKKALRANYRTKSRSREKLIRTMRKKKILNEDERILHVKVEFVEDYLSETNLPENLLSLDTIDNEILQNLKKILKSFGKTRIRRANTCIEYSFDRKKFVLLGGFSVPDNINIGRQASERVGEANLDTIGIKFKDSPLGLDRIRIRGRTKEFDLRFQNEYSGKEGYIETLVKSANYLKEITSLWVMEK